MISPGVSVLQRIEKHARERPHRIAAVCGAQSITYGDLNRRADALAGRLRAEGIGRDTLVGVAVERSIGMVVALAATWKAGGAYVPLDPAYPQARLAFMLEDAGVTVLVTQRDLAPRFDACGRLLVFVDDEHPEAAINCGPSPTGMSVTSAQSTGRISIMRARR